MRSGARKVTPLYQEHVQPISGDSWRTRFSNAIAIRGEDVSGLPGCEVQFPIPDDGQVQRAACNRAGLSDRLRVKFAVARKVCADVPSGEEGLKSHQAPAYVSGRPLRSCATDRLP